jgi:peroxiredoxin
MRKVAIWLLSLLVVAVFSGCAWETEVPDAGQEDSGDDGDKSPTYPSGPYGNLFGNTVENFTVERVTCSGDTGVGHVWSLEEYLGKKAILVTVHAGWCSFCKQQASTMDADLSEFYGDDFGVILLMTQDPAGSSSRQTLLDYTCQYRKQYGFSFHVAIDPDGAATDQYSPALPLNMILDRDMSIRYKIPGDSPDFGTLLEGNIEGLLNE